MTSKAVFAEMQIGDKVQSPDGVLTVTNKADVSLDLCLDGDVERVVSFYEFEFDDREFEFIPRQVVEVREKLLPVQPK